MNEIWERENEQKEKYIEVLNLLASIGGRVLK